MTARLSLDLPGGLGGRLSSWYWSCRTLGTSFDIFCCHQAENLPSEHPENHTGSKFLLMNRCFRIAGRVFSAKAANWKHCCSKGLRGHRTCVLESQATPH